MTAPQKGVSTGAAAVVGAGPLTAFLVEISSELQISLRPGLIPWLSMGLAAVAGFLWHQGLRGVWRRLLYGDTPA